MSVTSPNHLLASLASADLELLRPHLKPVELKHEAVLFEAGAKVERYRQILVTEGIRRQRLDLSI